MATQTQSRVADLEANMAQVILGKPDVVRLCIVTLLAGEHLLLEDVPGVGKTQLAKALASCRKLPHKTKAQKKKRATCEAQAKKKYGAKKAGKKAKHSSRRGR